MTLRGTWRWPRVLLALIALTFNSGVSLALTSTANKPDSGKALNSTTTNTNEKTPNFADFYDLVYQIQVIETETNNKAALGSGFQVSADGLVITNYHVVSDVVFETEHHHIEFTTHQGDTGALSLLAFDVVNDLALLQRESAPSTHFPLAATEPARGESIYALGNPHDIGMLMVDGAYNGLADSSFSEQILFSGSLNPGMSGGPSLNAQGEIVGVNVATAGSQLSFLVPVSKVKTLLSQAVTPVQPETYMAVMAEQIKAFQYDYFTALLDAEWQLEDLGDRLKVAGELGLDTSCWGNSNESNKERLYRELALSCKNSNHIYLQSYFNTGVLYYSYNYAKTDELNSFRFHSVVGDMNYWPDNSANDEQVTHYACEQRYVTPAADEPTEHVVQMGFCSRAYLNLVGLYDVAFYRTSSSDSESLTSHFTLAGVSEDVARRFTEKFITEVEWKRSSQ